MAAGLAHPGRVAGFRFFNPAAVMALAEVVGATATDDATLALLTRFLGEILAAVDWPLHLGGLTPVLDRSGSAEKITGSRFRL
jgi:hypothetical protein